nr:hypothetical protein Iba_chr12bCG18480 [Ipomoea batatas]
MHLVISWFEQAAGNDSVKTYMAMAFSRVAATSIVGELCQKNPLGGYGISRIRQAIDKATSKQEGPNAIADEHEDVESNASIGRPDDSITKPRSDEPPRQVLRALALNHRPHYGERRPIQNDAKHNRQRTHNRGSLFNCVRAHESAGNYPSKSNEFYYEQPRHFPPGFGVILVEKDGEIGELQENAQAVNGHDENAVRMDEWHGVEHPHEAVHQRRMDSADEKQFLIHYCTMGESIGDRMKLINPRMDGDEN